MLLTVTGTNDLILDGYQIPSCFCEDFVSLRPSGRSLLLLHLLFESGIFTLEFPTTVPQNLKFNIFPMPAHAPPIFSFVSHACNKIPWRVTLMELPIIQSTLYSLHFLSLGSE